MRPLPLGVEVDALGLGDIRFTQAVAKAPGIIETHDGRKTIPYVPKTV